MKRRDPSGDTLAGLSLIGMVHLPPLPGAARGGPPLREIIDRAAGEAAMLADAGFDGVIVENYGDMPFAADRVGPETIAALAVVVEHVVRAVRIPVGVNVLRNDAVAAISVAAAAGGRFVRVNVLSGVCATDQGMITGRAAEVLQHRSRIAPAVRIAADVHVKHAVQISQPDLALAAEETAYRAGADALIVTGSATGAATDLDAARKVRAAVPDRPLWIGSGVTVATVAACLSVADAVIVGTSLKRGGKTEAALDRRRLRAFVERARKPERAADAHLI